MNELQILHVVPLNDLKPHDADGVHCPCSPRIEQDGMLIIHNAYDGREILERAVDELGSRVN